MATKTATKTSPAKGKRTSKIPAAPSSAKSDGALMLESSKPPPTHDEIAFRAWELYQLRGADGGALNDWLAAEQELRAS